MSPLKLKLFGQCRIYNTARTVAIKLQGIIQNHIASGVQKYVHFEQKIIRIFLNNQSTFL